MVTLIYAHGTIILTNRELLCPPCKDMDYNIIIRKMIVGKIFFVVYYNSTTRGGILSEDEAISLVYSVVTWCQLV